LLDRFARSGAGFTGGAGHGARVSQIIDRSDKLAGYVKSWVPGIRLAFIGPIIVLIAVANFSWVSAVLLAVSVLFLPGFIYLTARQTIAEARLQQAALDELSGAFQTRAAQSGLIRSFRAIGREKRALADAAEILRQRTMAILRVAFLSTAVLEFFASVSIALVAVYIGFKLLGVFPFETHETLTLAEGLTILILAPEFFAPIRKLSSLHHERSDAKASADFLGEWLSKTEFPHQKNEKKLENAPTIGFQSAELSWPDAPSLPLAFNIEAFPDEITVLSGPSGSGKTSLLLTLLGKTEIRSGEVNIAGSNLASGDSIASSCTYLGQTPWLMEGTIYENIAIADADADEGEIFNAAVRVGLADKNDRDGLNRKLGRFGSGLSGGQRQRVSLARAIIRQSPVLLLDEPTAHLDAHSEVEFIDLLQGMKKGRTLLVASHSRLFIKEADRVYDLSSFQGEAGS
jgi:ATP-binding cassette subfamily C protein CydD